MTAEDDHNKNVSRSEVIFTGSLQFTGTQCKYLIFPTCKVWDNHCHLFLKFTFVWNVVLLLDTVLSSSRSLQNPPHHCCTSVILLGSCRSVVDSTWKLQPVAAPPPRSKWICQLRLTETVSSRRELLQPVVVTALCRYELCRYCCCVDINCVDIR